MSNAAKMAAQYPISILLRNGMGLYLRRILL